MKRTAIIIGMLILAVSAASAESRVSFQLTGGLNYAYGGDFAKGFRGQTEYLQNTYIASGEFEIPDWGFQFGGEFLYHFNERFAAGLGVGYFEHMKQSRITYTYYGYIDVAETVRPKYQIMPLTANVHFYVPWRGPFRLDFFGGVGCYLAKLDYLYRQDLSLLGFSGSDIYTFKATRAGFGIQGGVALEWIIDPKFSLLLNVTGRLASISGFSGDWTSTGQGDFWDYAESGSGDRVWFSEWIPDGSSASYDNILFQTDEPVGAAYKNVRQARLGLSGFTVTLGAKIRLF